MRYPKKYLSKNEEIKKSHDEQEDRIEKTFGDLESSFNNKLSSQDNKIVEAFKKVVEVVDSGGGTVIRFDNGIQFAFTKRVSTLNILNEHGSLYRNASQHNWTFPKPFKGEPIGVIISNLNSKTIGGYAVNVNAHSTGYYFLSAYKQQNSDVYVSIFAYGFWK